MTARILDPRWKYTTAEQSREPGYLAKKFRAWQREIDAQEQALREAEEAIKAEQEEKVRVIGGK